MSINNNVGFDYTPASLLNDYLLLGNFLRQVYLSQLCDTLSKG